VHSPDEAPQYLIDQFNATVPNDHRRTFAGMVAALDLGVGKVVDALTAAGIFENTIVVFTTDNGGKNALDL
jgi:arylsulfatase B